MTREEIDRIAQESMRPVSPYDMQPAGKMGLSFWVLIGGLLVGALMFGKKGKA